MPIQQQIFVFGSNEAGVHGAGAAYVAAKKHGAEMGVGQGWPGRSQIRGSTSLQRASKRHRAPTGQRGQAGQRALDGQPGRHPGRHRRRAGRVHQDDPNLAEPRRKRK